ncbi:MAG: hypothetical protein ACOYEV_04195 [Candidatus Nanopelagicales bacterium]
MFKARPVTVTVIMVAPLDTATELSVSIPDPADSMNSFAAAEAADELPPTTLPEITPSLAAPAATSRA